MVLLQGKYNKIIGIPRSGLTVAHMLSVHLNCQVLCLNGCEFRQSSGRELNKFNFDNILVVDDCCSYGNAINQFRSNLNFKADFGAVYTRPVGAKLANLDTFFEIHAEPSWLVVTEWNWMHHQDINYIACTEDVDVPNIELIDKYYPKIDEGTIYSFNNSEAALLVTRQDNISQFEEIIDKPILNLNTMKLYGSKERIY